MCFYQGDAIWLKDVDVHLKRGGVRGQAGLNENVQKVRASWGSSYLEVWHQPAGLQVQRVVIHPQLPAQQFLVVELKLNVASRRNVDLGLKRLHVQRIGPVQRRRVSVWDAAELRRGLKSDRLLPYLTIPAAFPRALAWEYKFLATVFSFTEPTNTIPLTFLQQKACGQTWRSRDEQVDGVELSSHGEVADESSFGDLDVETDALGFGA